MNRGRDAKFCVPIYFPPCHLITPWHGLRSVTYARRRISCRDENGSRAIKTVHVVYPAGINNMHRFRLASQHRWDAFSCLLSTDPADRCSTGISLRAPTIVIDADPCRARKSTLSSCARTLDQIQPVVGTTSLQSKEHVA